MRPQELFVLFSDVKSLKGAGPAIGKLLSKLLRTDEDGTPVLRDLLFHLPVGILDRRNSPSLTHAREGDIITIKIKVDSHEPPRSNRQGISFGRPYKIHCAGDGGFLSLVFFHSKPDYLLRTLPIGEERIVSGRFERTEYGWQISHPDFIVPVNEIDKVRIVEPLYPLTAGITNRQLRKLIEQVLSKLPSLPEWQDQHWIRQKNWQPWKETWLSLHQPQTEADLNRENPARQRIAYDEILANQLALALVRGKMKRSATTALPAPGALRQKALTALPFSLTNAQQQALREIDEDLGSGSRMLRLLQGDVGSGKTIVALLAMLHLVENGRQSALMVPTEILAQQHFRFIKSLCGPLNIPVALLTGSTPDAQRAREQIAKGEILLVIGTHALFQESVTFKDLGMVVVDEQHRFGVGQRLVLAEKGARAHILQMTATPIPRSLTMTAFGDMDVSLIMEKPKGRPPIRTRAVPDTRASEVTAGLLRAVEAGDRIYWICPLIEESQDDISRSDLAAAKARFIEFQQMFGEGVGLLHGRLKPAEREKTMADFASGKIKVLVATTVVEVGVDVPEATIMVIEQAERFGLAQLHQLRGRIGRGTRESHCILLYKEKTGEIAKKRLRTIRDTDDGFKIAEEDLRLRGAGDILGTKQSGAPDFRFADLATHADLILAARDDVKLILQKDFELTTPRGKALRCLLYLFEYEENVQLLKAG